MNTKEDEKEENKRKEKQKQGVVVIKWVSMYLAYIYWIDKQLWLK